MSSRFWCALPGLFAPNSSMSVWPIVRALAGTCDIGAISWCGSGRRSKPPSRRSSTSATFASWVDSPAATSSMASYRYSASGRRRTARMPIRTTATAAIGAVAATSVSWSATWIQASAAQASTGTYQRSGARSRSRNRARIGTAVPAWSGFSRNTSVPPMMLGASMIPAATRARMMPAHPLALPRARSAASSTARV